MRDPTPTETLNLITVETVPCPVCKRSESFTFPGPEYELWRQGTDPTEAFHGLSESEAWLLISGIHDGCWEEFRLEDPRLKDYARRVGIKPESWEGSTNGG